MKTIHMIAMPDGSKVAISEIDEEKSIIKYRRVGDNYDPRLEYEDTFRIEGDVLHVLGPQGDSKIYFHLSLLNPISGMMRTLVEEGIIKEAKGE